MWAFRSVPRQVRASTRCVCGVERFGRVELGNGSTSSLRCVRYGSSVNKNSENIRKPIKRSMKETTAKKKELERPTVDSTSIFRFSNPELFLDTNKRSTWHIVYACWFFCAAGLGYRYYQDYYAPEKKPEGAQGPVRPDGNW